MKFLICLILLSVIILETIMVFYNIFPAEKGPSFIHVGVVYSLTGNRAFKDLSLQQATLMAIDEINKKGGVLGKQIIPLVRDAQSNWETTKEIVQDLITNEKVKIIFGCWAPDTIQLKELIEQLQHFLIYPYQYEGLIHSPHIIFVGTSAHQQVVPALHFCRENFGNRFFLVGSQTIFSKIINRMIHDYVKATQSEIKGEKYLEKEQMNAIVKAIVESKPDVILNSLTEEETSLLFRQLKEMGIDSSSIPTFSFTMTELSLKEMNLAEVAGNYAVWNYFQSIQSPANQEFIQHFYNYNHSTEIDNCTEAAYLAVYLWWEAVKESENIEWSQLGKIFDDLKIEAPEGPVILSMNGRYAWKYSRIGKVKPDGQFDIVWESSQPIRPISYYHSNLETLSSNKTSHVDSLIQSAGTKHD
jgi:urea transport system substrate-binding protein